jgi:hypothetical protein
MADKHGARIALSKRSNDFVDMKLEIGVPRRLVTEPCESQCLDVMAFT